MGARGCRCGSILWGPPLQKNLMRRIVLEAMTSLEALMLEDLVMVEAVGTFGGCGAGSMTVSLWLDEKGRDREGTGTYTRIRNGGMNK